jgi:predicted methyltransferase
MGIDNGLFEIKKKKKLTCPNCKGKHIATSTHKGFLQGYCFDCYNHWSN